jgi:hypothetical protein
MTGVEIAVIILFVLFGIHMAFTVVLALVIGGLIQNFETHRKAVLGLAGSADEAFKNDRTRISQLEKFIIFTFKLDEVFGYKRPEASPSPDLADQVKKNNLKN